MNHQVKEDATLYRRVTSVLLACTYLTFWLTSGFHHFLAPEHQHEQKICHHEPGEKHIHTEEYAEINCSICQLALQIAELPVFPQFKLLWPEQPTTSLIVVESSHPLAAPFRLSQPRGPPSKAC